MTLEQAKAIVASGFPHTAQQRQQFLLALQVLAGSFAVRS